MIPLSSLWTWVEEEHAITHIIRGKVTEPAYTKKKTSPFTQDEIKQIVKATELTEGWESPSGETVQSKRPTAARDKAIILTLVDSGLRASELCALTVADYDQKRGRLHVEYGKGDKERFVMFGNRIQKALLRYINSRSRLNLKAPLFVTQDNEPMKRENLDHLIVRSGAWAAVEKVHPHRFRYTFAVNFLRNGGNVALLQELLGHESLSMVLIYVELAEQGLDAGQKYSPLDNGLTHKRTVHSLIKHDFQTVISRDAQVTGE